MSNLYITDHGATISFAGQRLEVKTGNDTVSVPIETLDSIEIFAKVQITSQAMVECLERKIPVAFHNKGGKYMGSLMPAGYTNVFRQRAQFSVSGDTDFSLQLSKKIIGCKIHNQTVLLRRFSRRKEYNPNDEIYMMLKLEHRVDRCQDLDELIGCEGAAARNYFKALRNLVPEDFEFDGRSKRPPRDPFNAMLSFGYSILFDEIYAKVEKKGLNAYLAFVHRDKNKHPALVSDLMEEWRAVMVDAVVMTLINQGSINKNQFYMSEENDGIYMNKEGRKVLIRKLEKKMRSEMNYLAYIDYPVSFRRGLDLQINQLVKAIEEGNPGYYEPVRLR